MVQKKNYIGFDFGKQTTPAGWLSEGIAIGAGGLGFNSRAYQIVYSYPVHMSNLCGSKGRRSFCIIINFLIHSQFVDVINKTSDYDIKIQL